MEYSIVHLVTLAILALHPDWREDACDRVFSSDANQAACEAKRDRGRAWAEEVAGYIVEESARQHEICEEDEEECRNLGALGDPLLMVAVAEKESSLTPGDFCVIKIATSRIVSRRVVNEESNREYITFTYDNGLKRTGQVVIIVDETDEWLQIDRCAHGEIGTFQLRGREVASGRLVPATGEPLPSNRRERRQVVLDPRVNTSLAAQTLVEVRDYSCSVNEDSEDCEADPWAWIGTYNTGRRSGEAFEGYARRVQSIYNHAREYVCALPDAEIVALATTQGWCEGVEVEQAVEALGVVEELE